MAWYHLAQNPKAISTLYSIVPELDSVHILEVGLNGRGWIDIKIELPSFPDKVPQRWKWQGYSSVSLSLRFSSILSFQLEQWGTFELVRFQMDKKEQGIISFSVDSQTCMFQGKANYVYITIQKEVSK
jgi:hypothetical protein